MGATFALGATTFVPGQRLPVLGGFPAEMPWFAPSCAGADCGDSLPGVDPPGPGRFPAAYPLSGAAPPPKFWVVSQENGPEFDALLEFWAVFSALRCDSRRKLRHNPRSGVSALSAPRSAAYETAQNCARALAKVANSPQSTVCKTAQNLARMFCRRVLVSIV